MHFPFYDFPFIAVLFSNGFACLQSLARAVSPNRTFKYENSVMPAIYAAATAFISIEFFFYILPPFKPYAWADDWIYALPLKFTGLSEWIKWLFVQHVDHRIPIQKLTNYLILRASGFDFRYMVAVNYLMGVDIAAMMLYLARVYRGYLTAGDMLIPLAILNYGVGFSLWGFQFAFLSAIFFIALFVFLGVRYARTGRVGYMIGAVIALAADALNGLNGLIPTTVATVAVLGWFAFQAYRGVARKTGTVFVLLILTLILELIMWKSWTPTAESNVGGVSVLEFARYMYSLVPASMVVFSFVHISWKFVTVALLFIVAMAICLLKLVRRTLTLEEFLLGLGALCSLAVIAAVAIGRSKAQGEWNPVIGMHYGFLSIFLPVLSWIIVSKWLPARVSAVLGIFLAAVFMYSFSVNRDWRYGMIDGARAHQEEIVKAMQSGADATSIADKYLSDFTIDKAHEHDVTGGIEAFRADGARLYGGGS